MKRWHEEYSRTYREWKKHYLSHVELNLNWCRVPGKSPYEIDCVCDGQKGRFRKMKAFDCGRPHCHICHWDKYPEREKSRQEVLYELKFKEQKRELDEREISGDGLRG